MSWTHNASLCVLVCAVAQVFSVDAHGQQTADASPLTREDAIALTLGEDPRLDAVRAGQRAAEARVRQEGRAPNPTLGVMAEGVQGEGSYRDWERAETTYSLSQRLELGGDRTARRRLAERERDGVEVMSMVRRLDVIEEVEHAFIEAQAAEAMRRIADERLAVAEEVAQSIRRRVLAARDPLMAGERAEARLAEARIEAERAARQAMAARSRLASYWEGPADFTLDMASFDRGAAPRDDLELRGRDGAVVADNLGSPDLDLARNEREIAAARVGVARARGVPDPDLQVGWRTYRDTDETAFVFGFSVPIPVWDRNVDAVAQARAEQERAGFEAAARARAIDRERHALMLEMESSELEIEAIEASVIPHSQAALDRAREGYAQGAFSYLDVLDAQRALSEARLRRIQALRTFHRAEATLARLTGARQGIAAEGVSP